MTKTEALEVLNTYDMSEDNEDREFCEALSMAISALEQEPCKDAISINSMVETIATKVTEDTEKFVFETIKPYCEEITKMEISKKDLERALTQYFSKEPCEDAEQIDYHDDFATALKKINDYEMTRDERAAISILNAYKVGYESGMEDLDQEPCEDAISINAVDRFGVLNEIYEWTISGEYEQPYGTDILIKRINNMPSVQPSRKGHWITTDYIKFTCSECGWEGNCDTKFCGNCGADMESSDADSD